MTASKERKKMKKTVDRKAGAASKAYVGFWTDPSVKSALQTRAKLEHKSASALIDEIVTDWLCGRRRK